MTSELLRKKHFILSLDAWMFTIFFEEQKHFLPRTDTHRADPCGEKQGTQVHAASSSTEMWTR